MVTVETRQKRAAGATVDKSILFEYSWYLKKQGYADGPYGTIKMRNSKIRMLMKLGANLNDPENVKEVIANYNGWNGGSKANTVIAYNSLLEMWGRTWNPPRYRQPESLPFIPLETEIDALINGAAKKLACFLQGLKDTGADPGELARLEWTDVNFQAKSVSIRHPVKGHNPRVIPVTDAFLGRLGMTQRKSNRIFATVRGINANYIKQRKRITRATGNPRILEIMFRTLRHWKGTMEYHKTKDILHVKKILGHKAIQSTMIYINLEAAVFDETNDEFHVKVAETLDQACKLIEVGFDYVCDMNNAKIFRKRK